MILPFCIYKKKVTNLKKNCWELGLCDIFVNQKGLGLKKKLGNTVLHYSIILLYRPTDRSKINAGIHLRGGRFERVNSNNTSLGAFQPERNCVQQFALTIYRGSSYYLNPCDRSRSRKARRWSTTLCDYASLDRVDIV